MTDKQSEQMLLENGADRLTWPSVATNIQFVRSTMSSTMEWGMAVPFRPLNPSIYVGKKISVGINISSTPAHTRFNIWDEDSALIHLINLAWNEEAFHIQNYIWARWLFILDTWGVFVQWTWFVPLVIDFYSRAPNKKYKNLRLCVSRRTMHIYLSRLSPFEA